MLREPRKINLVDLKKRKGQQSFQNFIKNLPHCRLKDKNVICIILLIARGVKFANLIARVFA